MISKPAWKSPRAWLILLTVMLAGFAADLRSKSWAFQHVANQPVLLERDQLLSNPYWTPIPMHEGVVAIPGKLLRFRLVLNDGAVFGIGSQQRVFFIIFTFFALGIAGWIFSRHTSSKSLLAHIALGLVLGGGLGNLYDRVFIGRVRDFMHIFPGIFNTGDVLLLTGMGLLMIFFWGQPTPKTESTEKAMQASPKPDRD